MGENLTFSLWENYFSSRRFCHDEVCPWRFKCSSFHVCRGAVQNPGSFGSQPLKSVGHKPPVTINTFPYAYPEAHCYSRDTIIRTKFQMLFNCGLRDTKWTAFAKLKRRAVLLSVMRWRHETLIDDHAVLACRLLWWNALLPFGESCCFVLVKRILPRGIQFQ